MKTEKDKLCEAVDEFAEAMKKRLLQKQKQGFCGWDNGDVTDYGLPTRLFNKAAQVYVIINYSSKQRIIGKLLVDIANFSMMIWRKTK